MRYASVPLLTIAAAAAAALPGQPTVLETGPAAQQQEQKAHRYMGAATCKPCHEKPGDLAHPNVELTEYHTWIEQDKHSQAYAVLDQPRSQHIAELLWGPGGKATERAECLNCHSVNWLPKELLGPSVKLSEGVTCDACHGPAESWLAPHQFAEWYDPAKTPPEKKVSSGMYPIWDPVKRAEMCLSCHLGNVEQGKVLEHRFYAAGHPPLPSFELDTFCESLPPHWKPRRGKDGTLPRVATVVLGGAATFAESVKFIEERAKANGLAEYANFDCAACHHELRRPGGRAARNFPGTPGRPLPPSWPTVLMQLGTHHSSNDDAAARQGLDALAAKLRGFYRALDARPLGDAAATAAAARQLVEASGQTLGRLTTRKYDRAATVILLRDICTIATEAKPDYQSARQLAWAFRSLYAQLDPKPARDAEIEQILRGLDEQLHLSLPSGKDRQILEALPEALESAGKYDVARFEEAFGKLQTLQK